MAQSLRERAMQALDELRERDSNRVANEVSDRLCKHLRVSPSAITIGQHIDRDGDPVTFGQVEDMRFVPYNPEDGELDQGAVALLLVCECGEVMSFGPITSIADLGIVLSRPMVTSPRCDHYHDAEPIVEGRCQLGNIYTTVPPTTNPSQVSLLIDPEQTAAVAELEPGAVYHIAIWTIQAAA